MYHPEGIRVVGIRSVASRQKGTQKEQEFIVHVFKGLALLPKADRRPKTWCQFLSLKNKSASMKAFLKWCESMLC